jgi:rod shape determining protein RodA
VRHIILLVLLVLMAAPPAYFYGLKKYQQNRLISFLFPEQVPRALTYQQDQSVRAIAAGGTQGQGVGESAVSYPFYIPDRHTDFVFSIIAQDFGFLGCTFLLLLYAVYFRHATRIAHNSREPYGRLVAVGLITIQAMQVFINVGMTIGVAPITGLTLPFVSYGGSSLVTCALTAAILLNIGSRWVPTFGRNEMDTGHVLITEFNPGHRFSV